MVFFLVLQDPRALGRSGSSYETSTTSAVSNSNDSISPYLLSKGRTSLQDHRTPGRSGSSYETSTSAMSNGNGRISLSLLSKGRISSDVNIVQEDLEADPQTSMPLNEGETCDSELHTIFSNIPSVDTECIPPMYTNTAVSYENFSPVHLNTGVSYDHISPVDEETGISYADTSLNCEDIDVRYGDLELCTSPNRQATETYNSAAVGDADETCDRMQVCDMDQIRLNNLNFTANEVRRFPMEMNISTYEVGEEAEPETNAPRLAPGKCNQTDVSTQSTMNGSGGLSTPVNEIRASGPKEEQRCVISPTDEVANRDSMVPQVCLSLLVL